MPGIVNFLQQADIFYQIPWEYREQIAGICREVTYQAGEIIFLEESDSDELNIFSSSAPNY
jgi:hypothetical protein